MAWATFFKSHPFQYGAGGGVFGVVIGVGLSLGVAYYCSSKCMQMLDSVIPIAEDPIDIPDATAKIQIRNFTGSIPIDINVNIPAKYTDPLEQADTRYGNCFEIPLVLSLFLTAFMALNMTAAGCAMGALRQKEEVITTGNHYTAISGV